MAGRPRILLDCDPGHDDAIAIVAAARHADLVGITTVAGTAPLERTTHNAMVMRDLLAIDVPVHAGSHRPLVNDPRSSPSIHGASGLDGVELPDPTTPLDGTDAVGFIIETCRATEGVWLVPVGPLTNIALALRAAPDIATRIAGISLMGGGTFGNRTPTCEYNIWADPEAAAIVFSYGGPLTMAGLDVTYRFQATPARIERIETIPGRLASALGQLLRVYCDTYLEIHDPGAVEGAAVHDPLAVLAVTHPQLFTTERRHVAVELTGTLTRGMTVIDQRTLRDRSAPNCTVSTGVDADAGFDLLIDAIAHFSR